MATVLTFDESYKVAKNIFEGRLHEAEEPGQEIIVGESKIVDLDYLIAILGLEFKTKPGEELRVEFVLQDGMPALKVTNVYR